MKKCQYYLLFILFIYGCNESKIQETSTFSGNKSSSTLEDEKDIKDSYKYVSGIAVTHKLSVCCGGEYLPVRKRILNKSEISMSNSGSEQAKLFNDSLILAYIYNDYPLELIEETADFYKIRFDFKNQTMEGYLLKSYAGKTTIKPFKDMSYSLRSSNLIINPELLPYCRVFVSEKFHSQLIAGRKASNPLRHLKNILAETRGELILYAVFVGQSKRMICINNNRTGSDISASINCIKNDYYTYQFSNCDNMFVALKPVIPYKIDSYFVARDTLEFTMNIGYDNGYEKIKLFPLDNKRAFTSRNGATWVLNDSIRLKDISYLADNLLVPETQIEHQYYFEILERYIQDVLPKRSDTYLEHYLDE